MIYITGDTHSDFSRFSKKKFRMRDTELTEQDYIIVCGDFGLCWVKDKTFEYHCKNFRQKQYTILWVQGTHENYDMIAEYPVEEWHGGKVRHILRDKVILLERGQVFEIEGKTFFTFGGASHDVQGGILDCNDCDFDYELTKAIESGLLFRIPHKSWWSQELPSKEEMDEGLSNLEKVNYKVDYVITHCCSSSLQQTLGAKQGLVFEADYLTDYLQHIEAKLEYKHWYFGHYHDNQDVDSKHTLLYYGILKLDESVEDVPIVGKPKYKRGDVVQFDWYGSTKIGSICIIDAYGTFEQCLEPSYDIFIQDENYICKHVGESMIQSK